MILTLTTPTGSNPALGMGVAHIHYSCYTLMHCIYTSMHARVMALMSHMVHDKDSTWHIQLRHNSSLEVREV